MLCSRFLARTGGRAHGAALPGHRARLRRACCGSTTCGLTWSLAPPAHAHVRFSAAVSRRGILFVIAIPKGFLPSEDVGQISAPRPKRAQGICFDAMAALQLRAADDRRREPGRRGADANVGGSAAASTAAASSSLKPRAGRPHVDEVIQQLRRELANVPGIRVFLSNPPPIPDRRRSSRAPVPVHAPGQRHRRALRRAPAAEEAAPRPARADRRHQRLAARRTPRSRSRSTGSGPRRSGQPRPRSRRRSTPPSARGRSRRSTRPRTSTR